MSAVIAAESISSEDTLASDLTLAELEPHIDRLAVRVERDLSRHQVGARTVTLKVKTAQFHILTRRQSLDHVVHDASTMARIARGLRQRVALPAHTHFRLVGVGAEAQASLL